jgi:hypothetical protein
MKYVVKKSHKTVDFDPLIAHKGEVFSFERKPTEWPGWIWCTGAVGKSAWVPESWVIIQGDRCRFIREYNAFELAVNQGEELFGKIEESGWVWVRNQKGDEGWVPRECLDLA